MMIDVASPSNGGLTFATPIPHVMLQVLFSYTIATMLQTYIHHNSILVSNNIVTPQIVYQPCVYANYYVE